MEKKIKIMFKKVLVPLFPKVPRLLFITPAVGCEILPLFWEGQ